MEEARQCRKMAQKAALVVENDDNNIVTRVDCSDNSGGDGYGSIAGYETVTIDPV